MKMSKNHIKNYNAEVAFVFAYTTITTITTFITTR